MEVRLGQVAPTLLIEAEAVGVDGGLAQGGGVRWRKWPRGQRCVCLCVEVGPRVTALYRHADIIIV